MCEGSQLEMHNACFFFFKRIKRLYKTAQNLKAHKLAHSGEKPYPTDQSKYFSKLAQALKRHKLMHSGERHCHCEEKLFG